MAKDPSNLESMDELLDRLANTLKDGDKALAADVRAELNRIDEEYNKPELRAFVCDLYRKYGYRFLTVGRETHRLEYPCVIIDVPPSLQNLALTQSKVIDEILQPLGAPPEEELINKGYNESQYSHVLSRLSEIENPTRPHWDSYKFALTQLTYNSDNEPRLTYHPAKYFEGIDTCDYLRFELLKAWKDSDGRIAELDNPLTALSCRNRLHSSLESLAQDGEDPIISGRFRAANIAVATLLCYPDDDDQFVCRLYRRSPDKVMVDRNRFHVAPSGMFEPCSIKDTVYEPRSLYENVIREYVEELFLADKETEPLLEEQHGWRWPYHTESGAGAGLEEALITGDASLHCTGIALSLVNLRMEILTLLIWRTREFADEWIDWMNPTRTEFARPEPRGGTAVMISLDEDDEQLCLLKSLQPKNMVIPGAAAFWKGRELLLNRPELRRLEKRTGRLRPTTEKVLKEVYVLLKDRNDKKFRKGYHPLADAKKKRIGCDIVVWEIEPDRFVGIAEADRCRRHRFGRAATTFGMLWLALDNVGGSFLVSDIDNVRPKGHDKTEPSTKQRYVEDFKKFLGDMHRQLIKPGRPSERVVPAKDLSICWVRAHEDPLTSELLYGLESHKPLEEK